MARRRERLAFVATIALVALVAGITLGAPSAAASRGVGAVRVERQAWDGETLFRGLFFGEGPVAQLFPEVWKPIQAKAGYQKDPRVREIEDRIIAYIRQNEPLFFDRFQRAMTSGDHLTIQEGLAEGGRLIQEALEEEQVEVVGPQAICGPTVCGLWWLAVAVKTGAVLNAYVAVNVLYAWNWAWGPGSSVQSDDLRTEMFIHSVATRLRSS